MPTRRLFAGECVGVDVSTNAPLFGDGRAGAADTDDPAEPGERADRGNFQTGDNSATST